MPFRSSSNRRPLPTIFKRGNAAITQTKHYGVSTYFILPQPIFQDEKTEKSASQNLSEHCSVVKPIPFFRQLKSQKVNKYIITHESRVFQIFYARKAGAAAAKPLPQALLPQKAKCRRKPPNKRCTKTANRKQKNRRRRPKRRQAPTVFYKKFVEFVCLNLV